MKSYTDINQSRKLAEKLPIESADMCYLKREINNTFIETPIVKPIGGIDKSLDCWSLAALLGVLPNIKLCHYNDRYFCQYMDIGDEFPTYGTYEYDNSVDACYEMIIRLNELKML